MEWLNYHHLLYFWTVAKEGGVAQAAAKLRLAHPTVIGQIRSLEDALGEKLFVKQGRRLVLSEMGRVVYRYADDIFALGHELMETVKGRPSGRPMRLVVGIADVVPKLIAKRLLEPARAEPHSCRIVCHEDKTERLVSALGAHTLDVVLTDGPLTPGSSVRAFNHLLGECGITFFARADMAARYRKHFPASLDDAPLLLPTEQTSLRRALDEWFQARGIRPRIEGEFDDSALMKAFGQDGAGIFPSVSVIDDEVRRQYVVEPIGQAPDVRERFYALSGERRIRHPAVAAICESARTDTFGP